MPEKGILDSSAAELSLPPTPKADVTEAWAQELTAPDVARRKAAVRQAPFEGGADAAAQLEKVIANDESSEVKEDAILTYAVVAQQSGVAFLRKLALSSRDERVLGAAHASLQDLRDKAPKRGWLTADFPKSFTPGKPFDVRVTLGSSSDVKLADLKLKLPHALQVEGGHVARWSGPLLAGIPQELKFSVVSLEGKHQGGSMARATLQYDEALDFEVLDQRVRFGIGEADGFFEALQPSTQIVNGASAPAPVALGGSFNLAVSLGNPGYGYQAESVRVRAYVIGMSGPVFLVDTTIPAFQGNQALSLPAQLPANLPQGTYNLTVSIDALDRFPESSETNNTYLTSIRVTYVPCPGDCSSPPVVCGGGSCAG